MSRLSRLVPRDLDTLSAYADGALSGAERIALEKRLEQDPALREALKEIRTTSALLRSLPQVRPPHSFTLTPEMAGVRLRTPFLQLATAVAVVAFAVTVGVDVFGGMVPTGALRAAAPAHEVAVEAPAEFAAADALEAGAVATAAETAVVEKAVVEETVEVAAAPMEAPAATPTAEALAEEYANRQEPTVGGAVGMQAAPTPAAPAPEMEPTASRRCEACGPELVLPTAESHVQVAATPGVEGASVTQEAAAQAVEPTPALAAAAPVPETRVPGGLPGIRWLEIGLGTVALLLGAVTLWARARTR
jgi:anti-sigma factor RsiW